MKEVNLDLPIIEWTKRKGYEMYDSGFAKGEAKGEARGEAMGEIKGKLDTLFLILTKRLGALPESLTAKISSLDDLHEINRLSDIALDVPTLDEFVKQLC